MTQLALALTVGFIAYALVKDLRQGQPFSAGMWISFAWLIIVATRPVIYWVNPGLFVGFSQRVSWEQQRSIEIVQSNSLDRNIVIFLMLIGLIILIGRRSGFQLRASDNRWLVVFFLYCLISVFWSDFPGTVFKKWLRFIGDVIIILLILTEKNPGEKIYRIFRRMAIILLPLSALFVKFYPSLGRVYTVYGTQMWIGVAGHKNSLGFLCAFTGVILVWRNFSKWPKPDVLDMGLLALDIYLLIGSRSTTSVIVFLMGTSLLLLQYLMKGDIRRLNRIIVLALCGLLALQVMAVSFLGRSLAPGMFAAVHKDASLTGRIPLWQELIKMGGRAPVIGCGFASFWLSTERLSELWDRVHWTPTTAHNGYVEIYLDLGLAGLAILLILLLRTYRDIVRDYAANPALNGLKIVLFAMVFFHNLSESSYGKPSALLWLFFLLTSIVVREWPEAGREPPISYHP